MQWVKPVPGQGHATSQRSLNLAPATGSCSCVCAAPAAPSVRLIPNVWLPNLQGCWSYNIFTLILGMIHYCSGALIYHTYTCVLMCIYAYIHIKVLGLLHVSQLSSVRIILQNKEESKRTSHLPPFQKQCSGVGQINITFVSKDLSCLKKECKTKGIIIIFFFPGQSWDFSLW